MIWHFFPRPRARRERLLLSSAVAFFVLLGLFVPFFMPLPVQAAGGVAITGSFYAHYFQIPQGAIMGGPDINVSVANTGSEALGLNMSTSAETVADNTTADGIHVGLSPSQAGIVLNAGESRSFLVSVEVDDLVTPGSYRIWVTGEPYRSTSGGGIEILPVVRMSADLEVVGESGTVYVETVGRSGEPIAAVVRLYRVYNNRQYEVAYGDVGTLQARVAPGDFAVKAESKSGELLAQQSFQVAANEEKRISLTVETIYFEGFAANPAYSTETGELGYAQITYTINNVYQPIPVATVRLVVTFNGNALEGPRVIHTFEPLQVRREGQPYDYRPVDGWRKGTYGFSLQLYTGEDLYASTREVTLEVGGGAAKGSSLWIIFVILGILGTAGLGFLIFFLLKRRQKGEKPEKAEKKRKEEKPARKAEEPLPKPEPYRPAEHVRPPEPVRYEEPTVEPTAEPATLSSVSSLKARMASLGRDQGTGKPAEEEPDAEKKDEPVETGPMASQPAPVPPPPKIDPERPAVKKVEEKGHKLPASEKPAGHKPGIFSKVTATGKKEPPKPPIAQGPAPVKPGDEITINWPPKTVEPPKPPGDVQINWPPKPVEPPKPSALEEAARQRAEAQQPVVAPEAAAPEEEAATEEPSAPQNPPSRSSFSEAARLRMEARQRASETGKTGAGTGESPPEGDATGGSGEGENRPPSP
jgi:hypothetical protein